MRRTILAMLLPRALHLLARQSLLFRNSELLQRLAGRLRKSIFHAVSTPPTDVLRLPITSRSRCVAGLQERKGCSTQGSNAGTVWVDWRNLGENTHTQTQAVIYGGEKRKFWTARHLALEAQKSVLRSPSLDPPTAEGETLAETGNLTSHPASQIAVHCMQRLLASVAPLCAALYSLLHCFIASPSAFCSRTLSIDKFRTRPAAFGTIGVPRRPVPPHPEV
jgi:hypothetical protein